MSEMKSRKGAVLVLAAFLMVAVLAIFVFVVDLSRVYLQKNELQTSTDAAALAGALELYRDTALVNDSAVSFGLKNNVLKLAPLVANAGVKCGVWDDAARTFTASAGCSLSDNAVEVSGSAPVQSSMASFMSLGNVQVDTKSIAWLAYVNGTKCVKPLGLPYSSLTFAVRPDQTSLIDPDPQRALTEGDLYRLRTFTPSQLRFTLKYPGGGNDDLNAPGNYGIVDLDGQSDGGGSDYAADMGGCDDNNLTIGTVILTQPGGKSGPTRTGFDDLCAQSQGTIIGDDCVASDGTIGVNVLVPLWYSATRVNGNKPITIKLIAAFKFESMKRNNPDKTSIKGYFIGFAGGGSIGTVKTTVTRPILVR